MCHIPYTYVSHFLKSYQIETKLHRLVPHEETTLSMCLVFKLDAWFGWKTRKCLVDTYTYVSSSQKCHVSNLVILHVCLAIEVQAQCMCLDFWFASWLRVNCRNGFSLFCGLVQHFQLLPYMQSSDLGDFRVLVTSDTCSSIKEVGWHVHTQRLATSYQ